MKVLYRNNSSKELGHGIFIISELNGQPDASSFQFSIRRASDQECLAASGWQPAEVLLKAESAEPDETGICLFVGPNIVDQLDPQETYRFTLQAAGMDSARATLTVNDILYSPSTSNQNIGSTAVKAKPEPKPTPPLPPVIEPLPLKKEILPAEAPLEILPAEPEKKGSGKKLVVALLALLLLAGGGFAVWKFVLDKEASTPIAPLSLKAQAHNHLKTTADPVEGLSMAQKFRSEPDGADPAFLLAEDAAEKGHATAMLLTGDYYDPTSSLPSGTIQKDALAAWAWFSKAKSAGNPDADARLTALKTWAETEATKGTESAKELLKLAQ